MLVDTLGLVLACVFFIQRMSTLFRAEPVAVQGMPPGVVVFKLYGALFFGAVAKVEAMADGVPHGTRAVVLEMHRLISMDTSGIDALEQLRKVLARRHVALMLCEMNPQPASLVKRSELDVQLGVDNICGTLDEALELLRPSAAGGDSRHGVEPAG